MIRFLTLFLGLVSGIQDVELSVTGSVTRVEIRLNDVAVGASTEPPWVVRCDFGRRLQPGRLEAVAFDEMGRELGRDLRWVNLPEHRAEAAIVPEFDDSGELVAARLVWESPEFHRPKEIRSSLDGQPVPVRRPFRIDLSEVEKGQLHVLDAEFQFTAELCLKRQLVFGKGFSGDHSSGLTAVPVVLDEIEEMPAQNELDGWFSSAGEPLRVTAVDRDRGRLVIVRDPATQDLLLELFDERNKRARKNRKRGRARSLDELSEDVEIRIMVPEPVIPADRSKRTLLFPYGRKPFAGAEGILKAATAPRNERMLGAGLMLGDAVALAGIRAAEGNLRRAVLLLLGNEREDISRFEADAVRSFLADLRVPLFVWDLSGEDDTAPAVWRADREIHDFDQLSRATRQIRYTLEEQRIVWLGGRHLPQSIELGPEAQGISLAK